MKADAGYQAQLYAIQTVLIRAAKRYSPAAINRRIGTENTRMIKKALAGDVRNMTLDALTRWAVALDYVVQITLETPAHRRAVRARRAFAWMLSVGLWSTLIWVLTK